MQAEWKKVGSAFKIAGNKPLGRPTRRLEDNIRMEPKEIAVSTQY